MSESFYLRGILKGHNGWVTQIATNPRNPNMILSSSRDKSIINWSLTYDEYNYGFTFRRLCGHSHFISDLAFSSCGDYALSGSWDKTLRLWDLSAGKCTRRFEGHTKDVLSVSFSVDSRLIVSGSRDKSIKLWNTQGENKFTFQDDDDCHKDWVSCVRFSHGYSQHIVVSAGWDKMVKVWDLTNCKIVINNQGHTGYLNSVTISPDGQMCASGGKDFKIMLWNLGIYHHLKTLDLNDIIYAVSFSPTRHWLCVAFGSSIIIWDVYNFYIVDDLRIDDTYSSDPRTEPPQCLSVTWSSDGNRIFAGYSDNLIRVWELTQANTW